MFVDLSFKSMGDFAPDKIAEQVPALAELLKMRRQLEELLGYMDGKVNAEKRIAQLLTNEPLLAQVADEAMKRQGGGLSMAEQEKARHVPAPPRPRPSTWANSATFWKRTSASRKTTAHKLQKLVQNLALAAAERSGTATISGNAVKSIKIADRRDRQPAHHPDERDPALPPKCARSRAPGAGCTIWSTTPKPTRS